MKTIPNLLINGEVFSFTFTINRYVLSSVVGETIKRTRDIELLIDDLGNTNKHKVKKMEKTELNQRGFECSFDLFSKDHTKTAALSHQHLLRSGRKPYMSERSHWYSPGTLQQTTDIIPKNVNHIIAQL